MFKATFSLCMYEGGSRNKHVTVLTNSQGLRDVLEGKLCKNGKICDRTGVAHETWTPTVVSGEILNYPTEADEEYPEGFCEAVAKTIVGEYAEAITHGYVCRWGFTEVFSGPNAPLTRAAEHAAKEFFGQRCDGGASGGDPSTRPPCTSGMVLRALRSGMLAAGRAKSGAPGAGVTTGDLRGVGVAGAGVATAALVLRAWGKGRINPEEGLRQGAAQVGSGCWGQGATEPGPAFDVIPPGGASEPESATSSARRELAEVTYRVVEEEKLEDVTRKRSREKGSKVTPQGESAAGRVEGRQRMRALDKECGGVQRGVDVLGVRRCDAPSLRPYARGAFERARAMLASPSQRKAGVEKLRSEVYAATSRRTRMSRIKTLRRLFGRGRSQSLAGYERWHGVAGGGTYRSAVTYWGSGSSCTHRQGTRGPQIWKKQGSSAVAALERGIGPAKRAAVVRLEALPGRWEQAGTADRARIDVAVVGAMRLLRGAEVAAILVEQAEVAQDEKSACLLVGTHQDQSQRQGVSKNTSVRVQVRETTCS